MGTRRREFPQSSLRSTKYFSLPSPKDTAYCVVRVSRYRKGLELPYKKTKGTISRKSNYLWDSVHHPYWARNRFTGITMFQQNEFDVTRARKRFGLSQKEMALALNVSEQTIRIWEHDFEASQMSKKTLELIELLKLMDEYVVVTEETIWLNIPLPIVQGRTPRQMILEGRMRDLIIEFLRLREGQSA